MTINLPLRDEEDKFDLILDMLSFIPPFSGLRRREKQVFAGLLRVNEKYKELPVKKRNVLIFDYDTRQEIIEKYGMSISSLYMCMMSLRQKKIITESSINPKYIVHDTDQITFNIRPTT